MLTIKIFGKAFKDMTEEEKKAYRKIISNRHKETQLEAQKEYYWRKKAKEHQRMEDYIKNSFAMVHFGKRKCEMTKEELKEYNRLYKQMSRKKQKSGE